VVARSLADGVVEAADGRAEDIGVVIDLLFKEEGVVDNVAGNVRLKRYCDAVDDREADKRRRDPMAQYKQMYISILMSGGSMRAHKEMRLLHGNKNRYRLDPSGQDAAKRDRRLKDPEALVNPIEV